MTFSNLSLYHFEEEYQDSLSYFNNHFKPFRYSTITDTAVSSKKIALKPSFSVGLTLTSQNKTFFIKYKYSQYNFPNGFSGGFGLYGNIPFKFEAGINKKPFLKISIARLKQNIDYSLGVVYYNGLFNHSYGFGIQLGIKLKYKWKDDTKSSYLGFVKIKR